MSGPTDNDAYVCQCHERMGNDFWFLPRENCIMQPDGKGACRDKKIFMGGPVENVAQAWLSSDECIGSIIEAETAPTAAAYDPFRGGALT